MPMFRQKSQGAVQLAVCTPVAGARAGTVNDAGGLVTNIDCRNYKTITLRHQCGVIGTSADCKLQNATASGGSYADITGGAVATGVAGETHTVDLEVNPARPWYQIVLVQVGATALSGAIVEGTPFVTSRP